MFAAAPALSGCSSPAGPVTPCGHMVTWNGVLVDGGSPGDAGLDQETCVALCTDLYSCEVADAGVFCAQPCVGGRAPPGRFTLSAVDASPGSWVARMAEFERAAVAAFSHLADELEAHGFAQPAAYALTAASQEIGHAQAVTRLALRLGHCPRPRPIERSPIRSLEEVALDNATEGCGRELLGALINDHQATTASDPAVRATMSTIARDEQAHADFSLELAGALMPRLTLGQRARVREAQAMALLEFGTDDTPRKTREALGLLAEDELASAARQLLDARRI